MAEDSERWDRVQRNPRRTQPFQAKASSVTLHTDANRRRNLDKEEAARDRLIFRWFMLIVAVALLMILLVYVLARLH